MYALAPLAFFLATVAAAPQPGSQLIPRDTLAAMTVAEAQGSCGSYQQVSCCGKSESGSNPSSPGLIGGLLNSLLKGGIFGQCSPLEVSGKLRSSSSI